MKSFASDLVSRLDWFVCMAAECRVNKVMCSEMGEHGSKRVFERKSRSKIVCNQMQAEGAIYFSCQMKSTLWFFSDGFPREFSCALMIASVCLFMFMFMLMLMMKFLSWLNECHTVNRSMTTWIGYYALLLSIILCLRRNHCCTSIILHLSVSVLLYLVMFKVLGLNLCHVISS